MLDLEKTVYEYYPKGVSSKEIEYDLTRENKNLINRMKTGESDERWNLFIEKMKSLKSNLAVGDMTTFAFSTTCFKADILAVNSDIKQYQVLFYISMLADYFAFKTVLIFDEDDGDDFQNLGKEELKNRLDKAFLENQLHQNANQAIINDFSTEINSFINPIIACQKETFNYKLFPKELINKIVPEVATNLKSIGQATLFDCIFTDFKL